MPDLDIETIKSAIEFWQKLYEVKEGTIKFTKKSDGTTRLMKATLDFTKIPKEKHPKTVNLPKILKLIQNSGIMHVYDLEKKDWRSVPFKNVEWLQTASKLYKIKPSK